MITKWRLFNFKSVRKETELAYAPLTIFAGPNSSGKSTWIQSMLLVSRTLSHKISSRPIVLNGALTKLGQFDDLRSFDSNANQITIGWECTPIEETEIVVNVPAAGGLYESGDSLQLKSTSCQISFDADPSSPQRDILQVHPRLFSCILSCAWLDEESVDASSTLAISRTPLGDSSAQEKLRQLKIPDSASDAARASLEFEVSLDDRSLGEMHKLRRSAKPVGCLFQHFLPERLSSQIDLREEEFYALWGLLAHDSPEWRMRWPVRQRSTIVPEAVITLLKEKLGDALAVIGEAIGHDQGSSNLFPPPSATLHDWALALRKLPYPKRFSLWQAARSVPGLREQLHAAYRQHTTEAYILAPSGLPSALAGAVNYMDQFFSRSVRYLGPLREEPKPLYPLAPMVDPSDVGLAGEYTAAVLNLHKDRQVRYLPTSHFATPAPKLDHAVRTLETATADWLKYLGVAESVTTADRGKLGHELKVVLAGTSHSHDLTHVGVGVSQVLPILVMCLLADKDTTLIFEQPELHLHPKVQTLLGDFFLSMALLGKQCVIETHSEYLINRLRFRAAAATKDFPVADKMKIYFVEKDGDTSQFRDVVVNEYGAVLEWPNGFFDQSQDEAENILKAAALKRKSEQKGQNHG